MNVILSGLTAAGKTTHCSLLAKRFGFRPVAVADVMLRLGGVRSSLDSRDSRLWVSPEARQLEQIRKANTTLDRAVDEELKRLCGDSDHLAFDAWALPWIAPNAAIKIWLESSIDSRVRKSAVSHIGHGLTTQDIRALLSQKDQEARALFQQLHGFDLFRDRAVFDLVVDISGFIEESTPEAAHESIKRADMIVSSFVGWAALGRRDCREDFTKAFEQAACPMQLRKSWRDRLQEVK